jgi:hypothetical protein
VSNSNIVPIKATSAFRALKNLADDADHIVKRYDEIGAELRGGGPIDRSRLADAKRAALLSKHDERLLNRCTEGLELLDPDENYEDDGDGDLRRGVTKGRLAVLIGGFPNGAPSDPDVYVRAMLEYVSGVEGFCLPALDNTIHDIIVAQKFLPAISEVLASLSEHQAKWQRRLQAISDIAGRSHRVLARIAALEAKLK